MTYRDALAWLFGTQLFGIKLGLENIQRLLRALDLSAPSARIIHVAGTNGKGSVCAMLDAILRAANFRTGLFTSPHLVSFRERIQVNGELICEDETARGLTNLRDLLRDWDPHPTFFEIVTALGLIHFKNVGCEWIVLETGMGGRLDATNATTPVVSVITPIDFDHEKWLGHSLAEIAREKAGIIKPNVPVVSAEQKAEAAEVLRAHAEECGTPIEFINHSYQGALALPGAHQKQNAALAVAALRACGAKVSEQAIVAGLTSVRWPARFQRWNERIVIDGAHNPAGARVLHAAWRETFGAEKATLIFGAMRDKDLTAILEELLPLAHDVILPVFRGDRVLPNEQLAEIIQRIAPEKPVQLATDPAHAMHLAEMNSHRILVAGSLHLAGEMLAHLQKPPLAFDECAQ